jgi:hypothetical protein
MSEPDKLVIRTGGSNWRLFIPLLVADTTTNFQYWNPDAQYNNVDVAPHNEIAKQFSYFAAYWLNRNKVAVNGTLNVSVSSGGTFYFKALNSNPVTSYQGLYEPVNGSYVTLTLQQDGVDAGRASSSYTSIPSSPRTLLHYISSFGITGSSSNNASTSWNSGYDTLTLTHVNSYDNYFSRNTRVKIIQGDGSVDGPDWVVFNFDVNNGTGDFHGGHTTYSYFGGESSGSSSTSNGGSGGLTITHGFIWGWANDKWNKLFQMELPGNGGLFSNSFAGWWASGNTVTSGNGKYDAYDTLSISHIGFSVQYTSSTLETLAPLATKITPELGEFGMTKTFGDSPFTITQPSSASSSGEFTYSVSSGTGVISMSGTLITILSAGTATVTASQAASGNYNATTKDATIQINQLAATLSASPNIFYRKFVSGASISFDVITSNAGTVARTHESSNTSIFSIPTASVPSGTIVAPGKIYINVIQPSTTNYTQVISDLITIVVIGQGKTYSSETFPASFDLTGTNLTGTIFTSCTFTETNLFGITINSSTNFSNSTLTRIKSGRIIGKTSLLPAGFTMI